MYLGDISLLSNWLWSVRLPRLVRLSSPGTGGRRRLWKVLWIAWVERMIKERMLSTRPKAGNNGKEDTTKKEIDCNEPSRGRVNL